MRPFGLLLAASLFACAVPPDTPDEPWTSLELEACAEAFALDLGSEPLDLDLHFALLPLADESDVAFPPPLDEAPPQLLPLRPAPRAWQPPTA
jgi:hypothetical protein